jgi:hypothetical protein
MEYGFFCHVACVARLSFVPIFKLIPFGISVQNRKPFHWSILSVQLILPEPEMSRSHQYMPRVLRLIVVVELCLGFCLIDALDPTKAQ